jgi:transcriptional regulator with XRE-family HTH domain
MPKAKERTSDFGARLTELRKAAGYTQVELAAALGTTQRMIADELLGIKPLKKGKKPDTQLHRRLQRIEKLDPKAKRQITQLLDTFIEREELKQRVNAQGA